MKDKIKKEIIKNFKNDNYCEIRNSIDESINFDEETLLPGLGILFEILWKNSDLEMKNNIIDTLKLYIKKEL